MHRHRSHRVLKTWFATLALLVAALAPTLTQAFGLGGAKSWAEVCDAAGRITWVQVSGNSAAAPDAGDPAPTTPAHAAQHILDHCTGCPMHAVALAMPLVPGLVVAPSEADSAPPLAFLAAPRTLHAWVSAQPRAPPASC